MTLATLIAAAHDTLATPLTQGALVAAGASGNLDAALAYLHRQAADHGSPTYRQAAWDAADALRLAYWTALDASLTEA